MKWLLDTHVMLWWLLDDARLSDRARTILAAAEHELLVSSASGFELATKHRLGKLWLGALNPADLPRILEEERMRELPLTLEHAAAAASMGGEHPDPFDRMLIAQSRLEGVPVITNDPAFAALGAEVIW